MIEITNVRPSSDGRGWAFDATIDGQPAIPCHLLKGFPRRLWVPQAAAATAWGEHTTGDVQRAAEEQINKIGEIDA